MASKNADGYILIKISNRGRIFVLKIFNFRRIDFWGNPQNYLLGWFSDKDLLRF